MNTRHTKQRLSVILFGALLLISCGMLGACTSDKEEKAEAPAPVKTDARLTEAIAKLQESYKLTVGDVQSTAAGGAVLKNVAFTLPSEHGDLSVTMATVTAEGIAYDKLFETGKADLLEKLVITGLSVKGEKFESTSEQYELTGVAADPAIFAAELADYFHGGADICEWLGSLALQNKDARPFSDMADTTDFTHSVTYYASRGDKTTIQYMDGSLVFFGAATEAENLLARKYGKLVTTDVWGEYNGKRFLSLAELDIRNAEFPADATKKAAPLEGEDDKEDLELGKNPMDGDFRIGNFSVKKLVFTPLESNGNAVPFSLENVAVSADFTDARQHISLALAGLGMEKKHALSGMVAIPGAERYKDMLAGLPETLSLDSSFSVDVQPLPEGAFSLSLKPFSLSLKDLGSLAVSLDMTGNSLDAEKAKVSLLDMTLADHGLSDIVFALAGEEQGKTGDYLRQEARMGLSAAGFALQGSLAELCANALNFVDKPGATLNVKIQPKETMDPENLGMMLMTDPDRVGLSSTLTREGENTEKTEQ